MTIVGGFNPTWIISPKRRGIPRSLHGERSFHLWYAYQRLPQKSASYVGEYFVSQLKSPMNSMGLGS